MIYVQSSNHANTYREFQSDMHVLQTQVSEGSHDRVAETRDWKHEAVTDKCGMTDDVGAVLAVLDPHPVIHVAFIAFQSGCRSGGHLKQVRN